MTDVPFARRVTNVVRPFDHAVGQFVEAANGNDERSLGDDVDRGADGTKREMRPRHVVMATGVSGIPSLITHEVNGLLIDDNSGASVADAVAPAPFEVITGALSLTLVTVSVNVAAPTTADTLMRRW